MVPSTGELGLRKGPKRPYCQALPCCVCVCADAYFAGCRAIFALGFISRPLGAILFGWIGDTLGRRAALVLSVLGVAVPSTLMGCLPTYAMIGQVSWIAAG